MKIKYRKKDMEAFINYINNVDTRVKEDLNNEIEPLKQKTKKIVKEKLRKGHGVRKGIYKKHIGINTLDNEPERIHFQVGGKKGHHRLTHLLENGHRIKMHGVFLKHNTKKVEHIKPAQDYADKQTVVLMKKAIQKSFKKGN